MISIKFKRTHPDAKLPACKRISSSIGDSGYDLSAVAATIIPARGSAVVPVGLTVAHIEPGYWFKIEARSGLGFNKGIQPHFGVIDNQYRGDLGIKLYNLTDVDYLVKAGDGIAQLVVYPLIQIRPEWSDEITETDRGAKGFGSSDETAIS